jgi:hypothetical protein
MINDVTGVRTVGDAELRIMVKNRMWAMAEVADDRASTIALFRGRIFIFNDSTGKLDETTVTIQTQHGAKGPLAEIAHSLGPNDVAIIVRQTTTGLVVVDTITDRPT